MNCSVVCDEEEYSYLLFDSQHPSNLVTCGLWATVSAGLERSGQHDAVGLNVSAIQSVGTVDGDIGINNGGLLGSLVDCFASFYAATHSLTDNTTSTPYTCSATAIFQPPGEVEPCFADLCAPRTLDADLGGIGVCSGELNLCRCHTLTRQFRSLPRSSFNPALQ